MFKGHFDGWQRWVTVCYTLDWELASPSLSHVLEFLRGLTVGSFVDRGRQRRRSAKSTLAAMSFAAFQFGLTSLQEVLQNPVVVAWKEERNWHTAWVKEAVPLPLELVRSFERAVVAGAGDDSLVECF